MYFRTYQQQQKKYIYIHVYIYIYRGLSPPPFEKGQFLS